MRLGRELAAVRIVALRLRVLIRSGVLAVTSRGHADGYF
jgi:hypothetical protein